MGMAKHAVKDEDAFRIGDALNPDTNPLTYAELHYFLGGLSIGFIIGLLTGITTVLLLLKVLGGI